MIVAPRGELFDEALQFKPYKKRIFINIVKWARLYKDVIWHATDQKEKSFIIKNMAIPADMIRVAMAMSSAFRDQIIYTNQDQTAVTKIVFLARISKDKNIDFTLDVLSEISTEIIFDICRPIGYIFVGYLFI